MYLDPAPSLAECCAIADAVRAILRQHSKTRLPWRKLCFDILSVLCGLRPAAMLDYAVVPRRVLLQLTAAVRSAAGTAGRSLITAEHEGVMYFLHAAQLLQRLDAHPASEPPADSCAGGLDDRPDPDGAAEGAHATAMHAAHGSKLQRQAEHQPRFIVFDEAAAGGKDTVVRWASVPEQQEVLGQLQLLLSHLYQVLGAGLLRDAIAPDSPCTATGSAALAAELASTHLLLDRVTGLPLLPTLNGWLLGYPAVYLLRTAHEVDVAARHLSSVPLLHCATHAECSIDGLTPRVGGNHEWLYAFTVPAGLATDEDLMFMGWMPPMGDQPSTQMASQGQGLRCPGSDACQRSAIWPAVRRVAEVCAPRAIAL